MPKKIQIIFSILAATVLVTMAGRFAAFAQEGASRGGAEPDTSKITVKVRAYDMKALLGVPALFEEAQRGQTIWLQRCAYCHDGVGQPTYKTMGPWLGAETVQSVGEDAFRAFIARGTQRMPGFRFALKPNQMDDLMAFVKTIPSSEKPTAAQLAGTRPSGNAGE